MSKKKVIVSGLWEQGVEGIHQVLSADYHVGTCELSEIKAALKKQHADLVVFCFQSASEELFQRVRDVKRRNEAVPIFIYIQSADVSSVVSLMKTGVNDVSAAPLDTEVFLEKVAQESHLYQLTQKIFMTNPSYLEGSQFEGMIGRSKPMQDNFQMIAAVAKSNATVLITGESGTGKELVAKAIHQRSERAKERFVDLNCGAIPKDLLENELFGHEKGAFTGAHKRYVGSVESAHGGTIFLDEISEMDVMLQVKLLRVLQERTITRIGSNDPIKVDVRIIAATNRNLPESIRSGTFREDLYYRLNVVNIDLPSLRERRDDIPLLAKHFLDYYSAKNNRIFIDFSQDAMEAMINFDWKGNVRELENTVERIVVLHDSSQVKLNHLPPHIQKVKREIAYSADTETVKDDGKIITLEELERQAIEAALMKFQGNVSVAAKKLKIGQATLYRKVKKFGLQI